MALLLNAAPVSVADGARVSCVLLPFESSEQLRELRDTYRGTHVLRRRGDKIAAVAVKSAEDVPGERGDVSLSDDAILVATLLKEALLDHVHGLDRTIRKASPLFFVSNREEDDLFAGLGLPSWLALRVAYEIDVRVLRPARARPRVAVVLDVRLARSIDATAADVIVAGVDVRGLYVQRRVPDRDPRLAAQGDLVGRVDRLGTRFMLSDCRPGDETAEPSQVFVEPRLEAVERCANTLLGTRSAEVGAIVDARVAALQSGPERLRRMRRLLQHLRNADLRAQADVRVNIGEFFSQSAHTFPPTRSASSITFIFDPSGRKTSSYAVKGLELHGPYTSHAAIPTEPRVCVIGQASQQGTVEQFLYKFLHGISGNVFPKGFNGLFAMNIRQPQYFPAEDGSAEAYRRAAAAAMRHSTEQRWSWDLAIVQVEERTHELVGDANPYLVTKVVFLNHQVPVQEFRIETTQQGEYNMPYTLRNMALATYAKLGGIPWLLQADPTTTHELVIGLGSAQVGTGRLAERQRLVGITTLFTGDGSYWLHTVSDAVPFDQYRNALLESLKRAIARVRQGRNWSRGDRVRLVFHAFKPFKGTEAEAVIDLAQELTDFVVEVAFVHVIDKHPFALFDEAQQGIPQRGGAKGALVPMRGPIVELGDREVLVLVTGARELKQADDGMSRPLLLRLHEKSTFKDLRYLAQQTFAFASHSWRGFLPAPMPVTVGYSQLIARLLGKLRTVSSWSPDSLYGKIGTTRWFL